MLLGQALELLLEFLNLRVFRLHVALDYEEKKVDRRHICKGRMYIRFSATLPLAFRERAGRDDSWSVKSTAGSFLALLAKPTEADTESSLSRSDSDSTTFLLGGMVVGGKEKERCSVYIC
jgi:hypothetical protein